MSNLNSDAWVAIDQETALLEKAIFAGNLELANQALLAGARTDGIRVLKNDPRRPALISAIFFNPTNRDKNLSKSHQDDTLYPDLKMVELLMQHGADPDLKWGRNTILIRVINHKLLSDADRESLVEHLLPTARKITLNDLRCKAPHIHPSLFMKILNHLELHQIEQPLLKKSVINIFINQSIHQNETMRRLIRLKCHSRKYLKNILMNSNLLPSIKTLEFAFEHDRPEIAKWHSILNKLLTVACQRDYWLYAVDLIRMGAKPMVSKLYYCELSSLLSIYPKEKMSELNQYHSILSEICYYYQGDDANDLLNQAFRRGAGVIQHIVSWNLICERADDFRYVLSLAQLSNANPIWTEVDRAWNPLYIFKNLPRDLQQEVIKVGFMAPSKIKERSEFRAPSQEHAGRTFLKLKNTLPTIEQKIRVQRNRQQLFHSLEQKYRAQQRRQELFHSLLAIHRELILNSQGYFYFENTPRRKTRFFTLFHGRRAYCLYLALENVNTLEHQAQIINHQLSFFRGEKTASGDPYSFWNQQHHRDNKSVLTRKSKWHPFKGWGCYYDMLKKMQQETEAAIQSSVTGDRPNLTSGRA